MLAVLTSQPGLWFVAAALSHLAAFTLLLLLGTIWQVAYRRAFPGWTAAYLATGAAVLSAVLAVVGLATYLADPHHPSHGHADDRYRGHYVWAEVGPPAEVEPEAAPSLRLTIGYRVDNLTAIMTVMVTCIAALIFLFSLGYMAGEGEATVVDHALHGPGGQGLTRRGRLGRFYLYLSLFCSAMLAIVLADNLLLVFIGWELVGVCSYFLIGFSYERPAAALAANKAFLFNRIGDAGLLIGLMILWTYVGTLDIDSAGQRLRSPDRDTHNSLEFAGQFVTVNPAGEEDGIRTFSLPKPDEPPGSWLAIFPVPEKAGHWHGLGRAKMNDQQFDDYPAHDLGHYAAMPYALFVVMGLGLFLGCVGKSAQIPLQAWLPDAMEGPTPVSALIHAATMVAAGVYLTARLSPLFAPEVLLVVASVGAATMIYAATIAIVSTDIKRVLAFSTVSQLGFMMLAIGVGGWSAGLLHLLTHACFKALLFLAAGSVIHGCHEEQDIRKMGGLFSRMPITAITMLVGVLAIIGFPLTSGWASKDLILASAAGYAAIHPNHAILWVLPLLTAVLTAFYMVRLWILTFAGRPRDAEIHASAHESPLVMTGPLVVLAILSLGVAWGWPITDPHHGVVLHLIEEAEPATVALQFGLEQTEALARAHDAGLWALAAAALGAGLAILVYGLGVVDPVRLRTTFAPVVTFLDERWYVDAMYRAAIARPMLWLAAFARALDKREPDPPVTATDPFAVVESPPVPHDPPPVERLTIDGLMSAPAGLLAGGGRVLRGLQSGRLRRYVLVLALTALAIFAILRWA